MALRIVALLFVAAGVAACGDPPPSTYPTQPVHAEDGALGPGDDFTVRVYYGSREMSAPYRVTAAGTISFPYIGELQVAGRTPAQVEEDIRVRLADGYLQDPIVSVYLNEVRSKKIRVFGQVSSPGILAFVDGMTVVDAVSEAGGFTAMARKNAVSVTRDIDGAKTKYTVPVEDIGNGRAPNFPLRPGDVVWVPERTF
jgi:polysaccharide export outer membrane protein